MYVASSIILIGKDDFREAAASTLQDQSVIDLIKDCLESIVCFLSICAVLNETDTHRSVKTACFEILRRFQFSIGLDENLIGICEGWGSDHDVFERIELLRLTFERGAADADRHAYEHNRIEESKEHCILVTVQERFWTPNNRTQMPLRLFFQATHELFYFIL